MVRTSGTLNSFLVNLDLFRGEVFHQLFDAVNHLQ